MLTESHNLRCLFQFPGGTEYQAVADLFCHDVEGCVFFHGVATFAELSIGMPEFAGDLHGGQVSFSDGRTGAVTFPASLSGRDRRFAFVGTTLLQPPTARR
jgi:hypothetical protein